MIQRTSESEIQEVAVKAEGQEGKPGAAALAPPAAPLAAPVSAPVSAPLSAPVEAILFVAREPVSTSRLAEVLDETPEAVQTALSELALRCSGEDRGVRLVEVAGGWRLMSNPAFADALAAFAGGKGMDRLSPAALETLAIIAYKQPASRAEIERIRGVGVGPVLRSLLEFDLIRVSGREEGLGRALLYGTTRRFLDHFGLSALRDLPAAHDF